MSVVAAIVRRSIPGYSAQRKRVGKTSPVRRMLPKLVLSLALAGSLGYLLVCEWIAVPDANAKSPEGRGAAFRTADLVLAVCFVLGLAVTWLP